MAEQVLVGLVEGQGRALQDRLDRARADARSEELSDELDRVTARDAVSDREGDDRCLEARAEGSLRHLGRKRGARLGSAGRAAQPVQAMLAHRHGDRGQLADLMALRRGGLDAFLLAKGTRARGAALGPVIDDLVYLLERQ